MIDDQCVLQICHYKILDLIKCWKIYLIHLKCRHVFILTVKSSHVKSSHPTSELRKQVELRRYRTRNRIWFAACEAYKTVIRALATPKGPSEAVNIGFEAPVPHLVRLQPTMATGHSPVVLWRGPRGLLPFERGLWMGLMTARMDGWKDVCVGD